MSAAETIQKAIEKLEGLRTERGYQEFNGWLVEENVGDTVRPTCGPDESLSPITNDELIVTLHRTIDAQLDILGHALARAESKVQSGGLPRAVWSNERDAAALALAILGEEATR